MDILPSIDLESTLVRLFPWLSKNQSGVSEDEIAACENELGYTIPQPLRTLYLIAGKDETVMSSFNVFGKLDELFVKEKRLIFVEENQEVCYWAVSLDSKTPTVYMYLEDENEWVEEKLDFEHFLTLSIYNQCIQLGLNIVELSRFRETNFMQS